MDEAKKTAMIAKAEDRAIDALLVVESRNPVAAAEILDANIGNGGAAALIAIKRAAEAWMVV